MERVYYKKHNDYVGESYFQLIRPLYEAKTLCPEPPNRTGDVLPQYLLWQLVDDCVRDHLAELQECRVVHRSTKKTENDGAWPVKCTGIQKWLSSRDLAREMGLGFPKPQALTPEQKTSKPQTTNPKHLKPKIRHTKALI